MAYNIYEALTLNGFLTRYFGFQIGRVATNTLDSHITAGYVLWVFLRYAQPWSSLLIAGAIGWFYARCAGWRNGGIEISRAVWFSLAAWLFMFGVFLLPVTKLVTYFIPSYPFAVIFIGTLYAALHKTRIRTALRIAAAIAIAIALALSVREAFFYTRLYVTRESQDEKSIGLMLASQPPDTPLYLYEFSSDRSIQYYSRRGVKHITSTSNLALRPPFHLVIPAPLIAENEWLNSFRPLYQGKFLTMHKIE